LKISLILNSGRGQVSGTLNSTIWIADSKLDSKNWTLCYLNERPSVIDGLFYVSI